MKILLCYSKDHFNPLLPPKKHESWGISANILAREFYNILSKLGDVTYSDGFDYEKHQGEKYDLFVGIERNFHKILKVCEIKKSILIAVNMHPRERNHILSTFAAEELGYDEAIAPGDIVDEDDICKSIERANYIFCFGNNKTYNSYIKNGIQRHKIKTFNYSLLGNPPAIKQGHRQSRFLYSASRIGLRKGYDIVDSLFQSLKDYNFHLDIVGLPTSEFYTNKITQLTKRLSGQVTFHGYVPAKSPKYQRIYQSNDFLVFPSLEEGQAGTVVEALHFGLVPLVSAESGIDFSPLGFLEAKLESKPNRDTILGALSLGVKDVKDLKVKTQEYYKEFHRGFEKSLEDAIHDCLEGHLYPKLSLILPIHNKEKTIKELIQLADSTAKEYKNIEAHIIFDGCTDNSEKVVRNYYKNRRDYDVNFYTTPNIFEVKSNNLGLRKSSGKYAAIIQDDVYIYDRHCFFEAVQFMDKSSLVAILGGLAGVNFYPLDTKLFKGSGQIIKNDYEFYWRQDEKTNPELKKRVFEVDACMRGPIILRKSFLEKHGYLDEVYAPLYQDDMDICFRARKFGFKVYCMLMNVANKSLTMANYDAQKGQYFAKIMKRNANIFYTRWHPPSKKDYSWVNRIPVWSSSSKSNHWLERFVKRISQKPAIQERV